MSYINIIVGKKTVELEKIYKKAKITPNFFKRYKLTNEFMEMYAKNFSIEDWEEVVKINDLSENNIIQYSNEIGWANILKYQKMTLDFMVKYELTTLLYLPYYIEILKQNEKIEQKTKDEIIMISKML